MISKTMIITLIKGNIRIYYELCNHYQRTVYILTCLYSTFYEQYENIISQEYIISIAKKQIKELPNVVVPKITFWYIHFLNLIYK